MPYKRKRKSRRPRRRVRRRRRRRRRGRLAITSFRMPMLMPDALKVPLKLDYLYTPTDNSGTFQTAFRLNTPYQPISTTGPNPYGWDQWATFYRHYYCPRSTVRIKNVITGTEPGWLVLYPSQSQTTSIVDVTEAAYQRYSRSLAFGNVNSSHGRGSAIRSTMSVRKLDGASPSGINYSAAINAFPSIQRYWHVCGNTLDGTVSSCSFRITIIYYVRFYRPFVLAVSTNSA